MKKKLLVFVSISSGIVILVSGGVVFYIKNFEGTFQDPAPLENPRQFLPLRDVQISTEDAVLQGWMLKQKKSEPVIIVLPDYREHLSAWYQFFSTMYDWRYNIIGFNLRGHDGSTGKFKPSLLFSDVQTLAKYVARLGGTEKRFAILAHGMSSIMAIQMLCSLPNVRLILLEDPVPSYSYFIAFHLWKETNIPINVSHPLLQSMIPFLYGTQNNFEPDWSCMDKFQKAFVRYIILSSDVYPNELSVAFYKKLREPKELRRIHVTATRCFSEKDVKNYYSQIREILHTYFPRQEQYLMIQKNGDH